MTSPFLVRRSSIMGSSLAVTLQYPALGRGPGWSTSPRERRRHSASPGTTVPQGQRGRQGAPGLDVAAEGPFTIGLATRSRMKPHHIAPKTTLAHRVTP